MSSFTRIRPDRDMTRPPIPRGVVVLGVVSLFMDTSSELIHSLLPVFLVTVLGASTLALGVIEGVAEATAAVSRVFSGAISDWLGRRKPLVLLGYGMAALSKPLFALASGAGMVFMARFIDRLGKGIRGAPRDALIADITPPGLRGAAYGLRQSMDTVGAFAGPVLALLLMALTHDDFRLVFWMAVIPAVVAVTVLLVGVKEPEPARHGQGRQLPLSTAALRSLPRRYWWVLAFAMVLSLARFSEAFLLLRAEQTGLAAGRVPLILIVMNLCYAASAYPFGRWGDSLPRRRLLGIGIVFLIAADAVLALAQNPAAVSGGAALWGLHMGATQGLLVAIVADAAPTQVRGTAFGLFHLVHGLALLAASILAGGLWALLGAPATFYAGALFAVVALIGLSLSGGNWRRRATG
jgi:MFS family permease